MMTSRSGEALVPGEQRRGEGFGEGDVYSIIGRQIVAQFPDPRQKQVVRIPAEGEVDQIGERRASTIRIELAGRRIPANDLRYFDIDQMSIDAIDGGASSLKEGHVLDSSILERSSYSAPDGLEFSERTGGTPNTR